MTEKQNTKMCPTFEQNHYRKQRELIDAGKLDYWSLPEANKEGILAQCKEEGEKYPELSWTTLRKKGPPYRNLANYWSFDSTNIYYKRIDPLPQEEASVVENELRIEIADLKQTIQLQKDTIADEKKANTELEKRLSSISTMYDILEKRNTELKKEIQDSRKHEIHQENQNKKLRGKLSKLGEAHDILKERNANLTDNLKNKTDQCKKLQTKVDTLTADLNRLTAEANKKELELLHDIRGLAKAIRNP